MCAGTPPRRSTLPTANRRGKLDPRGGGGFRIPTDIADSTPKLSDIFASPGVPDHHWPHNAQARDLHQAPPTQPLIGPMFRYINAHWAVLHTGTVKSGDLVQTPNFSRRVSSAIPDKINVETDQLRQTARLFIHYQCIQIHLQFYNKYKIGLFLGVKHGGNVFAFPCLFSFHFKGTANIRYIMYTARASEALPWCCFHVGIMYGVLVQHSARVG